MDIDFNLIKKLEEELKELLEERPEYKEWFYNLRKDINQKSGQNRHNRCAMASNLMLEKVVELRTALKKLLEK